MDQEMIKIVHDDAEIVNQIMDNSSIDPEEDNIDHETYIRYKKMEHNDREKMREQIYQKNEQDEMR